MTALLFVLLSIIGFGLLLGLLVSCWCALVAAWRWSWRKRRTVQEAERWRGSFDDVKTRLDQAAYKTGDLAWTARSEATRTGWLLCDGVAVSRTTFADLFAVIGTAFGAGDGTTTFNLPNLYECSRWAVLICYQKSRARQQHYRQRKQQVRKKTRALRHQ